MPWYWPFASGRDGGYTDAITAAIEGMASAGPVPSPAATAAAEACAGLVGRALACASVHPATPVTAAVSPVWLRRLGYDLIRQGEHLALIEVEGGRVRLRPASTWTFWDGSTPGTWRVQAQIPRPSHGSETLDVAGAGTVSILWAESELQPWRGRSPLSGASLTAGLLAASHRSLGAEQSMPTGMLLPVPKSTDAETSKLRAELARLAGRITLVETTASGFAQGQSEAPKGDWQQRRVGADPPQGSIDLQDSASRQIISACGVPLELVSDVSGAQRREAYREFVSTTVESLGLVVAAELGDKLDTPGLVLTFERLHASDMAGRARAAGSLVKAGWSPQEAAAAVMLDPPAAASAPAPSGPTTPMADGAA